MPDYPKELAPGVWSLIPGMVCSYLVVGNERALVIDTGFGQEDVRAIAGSLTSLPLLLVNTHYHGDHTGKDKDFDAVYAHPKEFEHLREQGNENLIPVTEGYVFDLGGRTLEVLETPGHTPGAIALLCRDAGVIFTGDSVADVPVFMQSEDSSLDDYIATLEKIIAHASDFGTVLGCHGTCPIDIKYAGLLRELALAIKQGGDYEIEDLEMQRPGGARKTRICKKDGAQMYRPAE